MRITPRQGYYTCSGCEETVSEAYTLVIGGVVFSLCSDCLPRLGRLINRKASRQ